VGTAGGMICTVSAWRMCEPFFLFLPLLTFFLSFFLFLCLAKRHRKNIRTFAFCVFEPYGPILGEPLANLWRTFCPLANLFRAIAAGLPAIRRCCRAFGEPFRAAGE